MGKYSYLLAALAALSWGRVLLSAPAGEPAVQTSEDESSLLVPKSPRTEAEEDRIAAAALFAHGRMLFQREDFAGALRRYQRAWRYHPAAVSVLAEIVPLSFELRHSAEAARYAVIAAESDPQDPVLLRRLGIHLSEQKDWKRALKLYEKTVEIDPNLKDDANQVLLRLEMGRLYFLTADYRRSADSFAYVRNALASPEKFGLSGELVKTVLGKADLTYSLLAESFLQAERFDEALAMFQKSHEVKGNKPLLAFQLARLAARKKDHAEALKKLDEYFTAKTSEAGAEPYELLADLYKRNFADEKQAGVELRGRLAKLFAADSANAPLGYYLAERLREVEAWEPARIIYDELLKVEPTADAFQGLIEVYHRQRQAEKLLAVLGQAVVKAGSLEPLGAPARAVAKDADMVKELLALAKKERDTKTLGEGVALAAGLLAIAAKQFDVAEEFLEPALAAPAPPKAEVMVAWGLEMFAADQYPRAIKVFRRALDEKVVPENNPALYFYLAGALEMGGQTDEAVAVAKKAAALSPKNSRFQSRLPWILYHAKRYPQAEERYLAFLKAFDADYSSDEIRETVREARLVLSNICVVQGKLPEAEEWLEQVLDEFPEHTGAMNDLGYLWADRNKHLERALAMVRLAVADEPENMAYRDSLGWALFRLGRHGEAVKELEAAAAKEDPDGVILDHLGDAYLKADQRDKALVSWQRAVKAFEKEKDDKKRQQAETKIKEHSK